MKLPQAFCEKMEAMLGEVEYKDFISAFEMPKFSGLRVNGLKCTREEFLAKYEDKVFEGDAAGSVVSCEVGSAADSDTDERSAEDGCVDERLAENVCAEDVPAEDGCAGLAGSVSGLREIPWCEQGLYFDSEQRPAKHPFYHAGLYYIQEPSAMLPGAVAGVKPGERVLDLCAAPGGKSTQVAAGLQGEGLLVSNDINSDRVKALVKNVELMGIKNAVVTCAAPDELARCFVGYFDKILIDAPCSGEGMFRKDERAVRSWENFKTDVCADMQREILKQVDHMLRPGGEIIYSTCTFSPDENEKMMLEFLLEHDNYTLQVIEEVANNVGGIEPGRPEWLGDMLEGLDTDGQTLAESVNKTARIWPHKVDGEGHFTALLKKADIDDENITNGKFSGKSNKMFKAPNKVQKEIFDEFAKHNLNDSATSQMKNLFVMGQGLYSLPIDLVELPSFAGVKIAKYGWYLGEFKNEKFSPSQSMITALSRDDFKNTIQLNSEDRRVASYLKGETLQIEANEIDGNDKKALSVICADEFPLGWGKLQGCMLKNMYPKGWREMR